MEQKISENRIEKENMKGFLPKGDKNVGKCFNAGKNCKDYPVHHPFNLKKNNIDEGFK